MRAKNTKIYHIIVKNMEENNTAPKHPLLYNKESYKNMLHPVFGHFKN